MVGLFSWLSKKEDINYEKILSELDDKISQSEMRIAEYGLRERRLLYAWLFYSLPAYAIVLVVYALYYRWSDESNLGRAGITAWYQRCRVVQGLIDRYDGPQDQQRNLQNNPQQPLQVNPQQNTHQQQQSQPGSPLQLERNISHTHAPNPHHPNSILVEMPLPCNYNTILSLFGDTRSNSIMPKIVRTALHSTSYLNDRAQPELTAGVSDTAGIRHVISAADRYKPSDEASLLKKTAIFRYDTSSERETTSETFSEVVMHETRTSLHSLQGPTV
ncbi:hypothetical protein BASA61_005081 [Batrachochytrium salamandrivorans]|nr:hypothetical protein BASA61_005081 [Batrachochytrium salamandrivorans]